jgi:hypothetical protein
MLMAPTAPQQMHLCSLYASIVKVLLLQAGQAPPAAAAMMPTAVAMQYAGYCYFGAMNILEVQTEHIAGTGRIAAASLPWLLVALRCIRMLGKLISMQVQQQQHHVPLTAAAAAASSMQQLGDIVDAALKAVMVLAALLRRGVGETSGEQQHGPVHVRTRPVRNIQPQSW